MRACARAGQSKKGGVSKEKKKKAQTRTAKLPQCGEATPRAESKPAVNTVAGKREEEPCANAPLSAVRGLGRSECWEPL